MKLNCVMSYWQYLSSGVRLYESIRVYDYYPSPASIVRNAYCGVLALNCTDNYVLLA